MALVDGGGEKLDSHNLRDFLRIKDDDRRSNNLNQISSSSTTNGGHNPPTLTLNAILSDKRRPPPSPPLEPPLQRIQSNRTLLDIIRDDQTSGGGAIRDGRRSWRQLREKIRGRSRGGAAAAAWSTAVPIPASDVPIHNNRTMMMMTTRRHSTRFDVSVVDPTAEIRSERTASGRFEHNSSLTRRRSVTGSDRRRVGDDEEAEEEDRGGDAAEQPVRMSLMALLAENDRQLGLEGSAYVASDMEEDEVAEEEEEEEESSAPVDGGGLNGGGGGYNNCCVCMVRHKGAAFIPCGHTFCRLCSRELWVQRGNCPLCNNYILEILDIF